MVKKQRPVRAHQTLTNPETVTMAMDPGLAALGIAAVSWPQSGRPRLLSAQILQTKKASKKDLQQIRVATDDMRRVRELWGTVRAWLAEYQPRAVAIEGYSPIPGKQGHGSWKVGAVTYALVALCWAHGIEPVIARPADLRRHFLRRESGSKMDIEQAVGEVVTGAAAVIDAVARSKREHLADSIGYAVVAHHEMQRIRQLAGL